MDGTHNDKYFKNPYDADFRIKGYNFMVCDISKHTITADNQVLIVPFKNDYYATTNGLMAARLVAN